MNSTATTELPAHIHLPDAENGLPTSHHNGQPNKSDLIDRIAKDLPPKIRERLKLEIIYPYGGD